MEIFNVTTLAIILAVSLAVFLIMREVNCWYWKINKRIELQEEANSLLRKLINKTEQKNESENIQQEEIISEQDSVNDPKVMEELMKKYGEKK